MWRPNSIMVGRLDKGRTAVSFNREVKATHSLTIFLTVGRAQSNYLLCIKFTRCEAPLLLLLRVEIGSRQFARFCYRASPITRHLKRVNARTIPTRATLAVRLKGLPLRLNLARL